jgi:hypothetical protein
MSSSVGPIEWFLSKRRFAKFDLLLLVLNSLLLWLTAVRTYVNFNVIYHNVADSDGRAA